MTEQSNDDFRNSNESIEIFFDSRTKKLTGLGVLRSRIAIPDGVGERVDGAAEDSRLCPVNEAFGDLLDNFVVDLCEVLEGGVEKGA